MYTSLFSVHVSRLPPPGSAVLCELLPPLGDRFLLNALLVTRAHSEPGYVYFIPAIATRHVCSCPIAIYALLSPSEVAVFACAMYAP